MQQVNHLHHSLHAPLGAVGQHPLLPVGAGSFKASDMDFKYLDWKLQQLCWHLTQPDRKRTSDSSLLNNRLLHSDLTQGWEESSQRMLVLAGGQGVIRAKVYMVDQGCDRLHTDQFDQFGTVEPPITVLCHTWTACNAPAFQSVVESDSSVCCTTRDHRKTWPSGKLVSCCRFSVLALILAKALFRASPAAFTFTDRNSYKSTNLCFYHSMCKQSVSSFICH